MVLHLTTDPDCAPGMVHSCSEFHEVGAGWLAYWAGVMMLHVVVHAVPLPLHAQLHKYWGFKMDAYIIVSLI